MKSLIHNSVYCFLLITLLAGCRKEKSVDTGDFNPIFIGNNCRIDQVLAVDSLSGIGLYAHNALFNAAGVATTTTFTDSITNTNDFTALFTYRGDTTFTGAGQFFLKDAAGRMKEYKGLEDPSDPFSDSVRVTFTYNIDGYLTKKEYFFFGLPIPLLQSNYTYSNGNLTKTVLTSLFPTIEVLVDAVAEYNTTQPAKEFVYLFPDAFDISPYTLSLNFGKKPTNTIKKLTTKLYSNGMLTDSLVTNYKNYKLSRDGYVLELFAEGDYQDGLGIIDGRTKFRYKCR
jgi:hypothetical protein